MRGTLEHTGISRLPLVKADEPADPCVPTSVLRLDPMPTALLAGGLLGRVAGESDVPRGEIGSVVGCYARRMSPFTGGADRVCRGRGCRSEGVQAGSSQAGTWCQVGARSPGSGHRPPGRSATSPRPVRVPATDAMQGQTLGS